jgi:hypothetical protein
MSGRGRMRFLLVSYWFLMSLKKPLNREEKNEAKTPPSGTNLLAIETNFFLKMSNWLMLFGYFFGK